MIPFVSKSGSKKSKRSSWNQKRKACEILRSPKREETQMKQDGKGLSMCLENGGNGGNRSKTLKCKQSVQGNKPKPAMIMCATLEIFYLGGQRDSTGHDVHALHMSDLSSIPGARHGVINPS